MTRAHRGSSSSKRSSSKRSSSGTRTGRLFRRASRWQKAVVVGCALVALHGIWVLFVPGVQLDDSDLSCPPAVVAAVAGSGGVEVAEGGELAERHDAACAATGRRWLLGGILQVGIAAVWGLAVLEWGRVWRRSRRRSRRRSVVETS